MNIQKWSDCLERYKPATWPVPKSTFEIHRNDTVFTIGSCFARNIEEHLSRKGLNVPALSFTPPLKERSEIGARKGKGRPNSIINKYTTPSIRQEIEWFKLLIDSQVDDFEKITMGFVIDCGDGLYIDSQLSGFVPVTYDRLMQRRREWFEVMKSISTCDVVVITLGLVEAWYHKALNIYIQEMPRGRLYRKIKDEIVPVRLGFDESFNDIDKSIKIIRDLNREVKFILTVSPVPFGRTFCKEDVICANMYSKSVLRAVAQQVVDKYEKVDYFPSYEIVTCNTHTHEVWNDDMIHVRSDFVGKIVSHLEGAYFT